jgi:four helix bundle protein
MSNIAEGFDARTDAEFIRFLGYARRSASELQSQTYIALDQDYISQEEFNRIYAQATKTKALIGGFIRYGAKKPGYSERTWFRTYPT